MNIIEAIKEPDAFRPFLADADGEIGSWRNWQVALRCLYGLPITAPYSINLVRECTGRVTSSLPEDGFNTALFLTGRRSGKSRMAAVVACFEAVLSGKEKLLAPGEQGIVPVVSPTRKQSSLVKSYCHGLFKSAPLLANEVVEETKDGFTLKNGVRIEILTGDWKVVRGFTLLGAAIVDEVCFMSTSEECKVTDVEICRALVPGLATTNGKLICISSPYARKGWAWEQHRRNFGNDAGTTLVWQAPSQVMNPTLPDYVIRDALAEDPESAKAEYLAQFRSDVGQWLPLEVITNCMVKGRKQLRPQPGTGYVAFADLSGGRNDDSALAIGHRRDRKVVVDYLGRWKPPHNPYEVVREMVDVLRSFRCERIVTDAYGAEWVSRCFVDHRITHERAVKNKSLLYAELLPHLTSGEIELLDDEASINQLANLERRTHQGGKDKIDHPPGGHDDLANVIAGLADLAGFKSQYVGGFDVGQDEEANYGFYAPLASWGDDE